MKRGDVITVAISGDFGKPRPAVVVQSDDLSAIDTTMVAMMTTTDDLVSTFRIPIEPSAENGLRSKSILMMDKIMVVWRVKCGPVIGRLQAEQMAQVDTCIALVFGLNR
jgi:mRNA interferase MazF